MNRKRIIYGHDEDGMPILIDAPTKRSLKTGETFQQVSLLIWLTSQTIRRSSILRPNWSLVYRPKHSRRSGTSDDRLTLNYRLADAS